MTPGRLSLSLSLVLHIGLGIAFTRAALSPGSPLAKNAPEIARPDTPPNYAAKVEEAQQQLQKLAEVANALEELQKEKPAPSPPDQQRSDEKAAEQAAKEAASAQAEAVQALKKAQATTPPDSKALDEARAAQARAFLAQDKLQQALLRPTEKPQVTPSQRTAEEVLKHALERQAAAQAALKQAQEALQQAQKARTPEAQARASEALKAAQAAQQEAGKAQEPVEQKVRVAHYDREQVPPSQGHPGGSLSDSGTRSMAEALLKARAAETKIEALYEALKGAGAGGKGTSGNRDEGLPDALKKDGAGAAASAVNAAEAEIEAIAARAQRLLDQAQGRTGTEASLVLEKLAVLASQDKSGRVADLTELMTKGEGKRGGGERRALPGDPASNLPAGATNPPEVSNAILANAIPGRRIMGEGGQKPNWLFVDSWYVVGPFPNPNRQNLRTRFGPEEGVDLDAQFQGAGGQTMGWKFWQTNSPRVVPPNAQEYAIYYLFTELYSDRARDLWLVIGSDDQSNLWVNEQLVWMSSDQLKGWQVGEGLRRVRLKQGRNRILLRLENGWRGTDTSLLLSLTK